MAKKAKRKKKRAPGPKGKDHPRTERRRKLEAEGPATTKEGKPYNRKPKVAPAWQRKPRPWEPGGTDSHRLNCTPKEFISRCCMGWAHGIPNKSIAAALGVNYRDFSHWVGETEEARPKFLFTVELWGEEQRVRLTFGELMNRMKEVFEPVYIQKLRKLIGDAEIEGDVKTATSNLRWLMEKQMPHKYGKQQTLNVNQIPVQIKGTEDLDIEDI